MRLQDYLISARFLTTIGHLTALVLIFSSIDNNIQKALPDVQYQTNTEYDTAYSTSIIALSFGCVCFAIDFYGIFFGSSLFNTTANMIQIFFHFIGSILLCWLITEIWSHEMIWPIVIICNLPTALMEIGIIFRLYVFRVAVY